MKNYNLKLIYLLLFSFLSITLSSFAQTKELTWNYPVRPGTEQWKQLGSFPEKINAFNIPDTILTKMTTENLVKTCLRYPWWMLIITRDNNQAGYDYLKSVFNGFRELENRKDAGKELLKIYEKMEPEDINLYDTDIKQGKYCFQFTYIETLLAQPNILENTTSEYLDLIVKKTISAYEKKHVHFDKFSYYGISSSCLIIDRLLKIRNLSILNQLKNNLPELDNFDKCGVSGNLELLNKLVYTAKETKKI
jgi:hypothetical protein